MPKFSDEQREKIGRKFEENTKLAAKLCGSFAKAYPAFPPAAPRSLDEATQNALRQIEESTASMGTLGEAAAKAAAEVQRSYEQIGTLDEAAQRALDQTRANEEKIGTLQEAAAKAYKTVIENTRRLGFDSGTAFAGAFRNAHKPVPEGCDEAGAFADEFAKLSLDYQASVADALFAPPSEGSDLEDRQTAYQQQVNELMEKYAGDFDKIKAFADALAELSPADGPGETEPSSATTKWHIECTESGELIYGVPGAQALNTDPTAPQVTLASMTPGDAPQDIAGPTFSDITTYQLTLKHLAADAADATPAGNWRGQLSAIVSATRTIYQPDGTRQLIAYDTFGSNNGTVEFRLDLASEPNPDLTPLEAYYRGGGNMTLEYEAGGEYVMGPNQGKRVPPQTARIFIPFQIEAFNGDVTIKVAGGATPGAISGRMLAVVTP